MTAEEIRTARESLGLSQSQAARMVGVTKRCWQYYEAGKRNIPEPVARLLRLSSRRSVRILKKGK
jgi:DNA-binding transcriptional regulator YiaG